MGEFGFVLMIPLALTALCAGAMLMWHYLLR